MPAVDFSRQLLAPQPYRLLAVSDTTSGWADLGSATRVMDILARNKIHPAWLRDRNNPSAANAVNRRPPRKDYARQDHATNARRARTIKDEEQRRRIDLTIVFA